MRYVPKLLGARRPVNAGGMLLLAMVLGSLGLTIVVVGISGYAISENQAARHRKNSEYALQIAEAGVNYYRWHLAHYPADLQDGTNGPGPYIHDYISADGQTIGRYSLDIAPASASTSLVTIASTGWLLDQPASRRTVRVKIGFEALTDYVVASNAQMWVGNDTIVSGPMYSNSGIRFDGVATAPIASAVSTYLCQPVHGEGCQNEVKPGVWGQGGPESFWQFPAPAQDFSVGATVLSFIKTKAQNGGLYISSSGKQGWRLQFNSDGTLTLYKVNAVKCYWGEDLDDTKKNHYCVDVKTTESGATYPWPANGFMYIEDTTWIDGTVRGRLTVGVGGQKSAIINGDILYAAKDGSDLLGVTAEQHIILPHDSPDTLEIDGAWYAQNGAARRYYYTGNLKESLTIYGSVVSAGVWTWNWVSQGGAVVSGYRTIIANHDSYLTHNPPGGFPLSSNPILVGWEEVR